MGRLTIARHPTTTCCVNQDAVGCAATYGTWPGRLRLCAWTTNASRGARRCMRRVACCHRVPQGSSTHTHTHYLMQCGHRVCLHTHTHTHTHYLMQCGHRVCLFLGSHNADILVGERSCCSPNTNKNAYQHNAARNIRIWKDSTQRRKRGLRCHKWPNQDSGQVRPIGGVVSTVVGPRDFSFRCCLVWS